MNPKPITGSRKVIIPLVITLALMIIAIVALAQQSSVTYMPVLNFTPVKGTSGQTITITVQNGYFSPYATVEIYFNNTYITSVSANATGGVYAIIQVPYNLSAGSYNITAISNGEVAYYEGYLFNETFSLSPGFGPPGSTVYFTGFGFQPGETVKVYFDGTVVATVTANSSGYVSGSFTVPLTATVGSQKPNTVVAVGQTSGVTYVSLFYVTNASITLSEKKATMGTNIYVSGSGFPANQYVVLCFNNIVVNTAYTSSSGTFVTNFTVPQMPNGTYPVVAMASINAVPIGSKCPFVGEAYEGGYAKANLTVVPSLVVSTTTTCPQYSITVTGYGFPANTSIALLLNGTTLQTTTTNSSGTFTITITAPQTPGTYTLTTNVTYMGYPTPVTINVTPPYVQVNGQSSVSGIVGGTVTVSGACFPPTKPVNLYINNVEYPSVTTTSSQGSFSVNVDLPLLPPGTYTVYAEVNNIHSVVNASVTILQPQIVSVTPTAGGEGSCFVIKGINFANATLYSIAVTINGATYTYGEYSEYVNRSSVANAFGVSCSQSVTLYANGTVILPVIVPVTTPGPYTVYVNSTVHSSLISPTGVPSTTPEEIVPSTITAPNDTLYATTSFTVQPSYITVTPTQVVGGQQILITGYNFYPGSPVTIIVNGTNVTSVIVGSNGQFSATYTVPSYLTSGVLYIVAEENYTSYIAGTPPNAVGNATATVKIVNFYIAVLDDLTKLLQCCSSVNATLQQLMSKVEGVASEVSTVYSTVLSMNSTLTSISSTLSSISSTLSSMQSTLTSIQGMLSSISNTLTTIQGILTADFSTVISDLSSMQSTLSTINSNVLSVNSTVTYYAQQLLSGISNIQSMIQGLQTTLSSQYSTIEGQLGAIGSGLVSVNNTVTYYGSNILSAVQSINTTVQSVKSVVPSVMTGYGSYTFTAPGTYTIYQSSTVGQITVTLYYTGYSTVYIYVYPIPGDTTHVVKLQVTSSAGYTVTVSGWRVDVYVTSASSVSPVTVYYSYTAIS